MLADPDPQSLNLTAKSVGQSLIVHIVKSPVLVENEANQKSADLDFISKVYVMKWNKTGFW